ncbi:MAG: hypothetical protein FWG10_07335 [Eubacteriaceae bacterium]|nr:hypothetical protein [Eubacteriaceae bacterium]
MSAKALELTLGTSCHVAWMMLQRSRVAMVNSEMAKLAGGQLQLMKRALAARSVAENVAGGGGKDIAVIAVL